MSGSLPPSLSPRPAAPDPGTKRSAGSSLLRALATGLAAAVLLTSVAGWGLLTYYDGKISRIPGLGSLLAHPSDGPVNVLVVGADSRAGLTAAQRKALSLGGGGGGSIGQRSDTMMLVHVSADRRDVTVVSLPRDSYVTIPAYTDSDGDHHAAHQDKLNAAFSYGGAPLLIRTVTDLTGLSINHYVEVGFAGVVNMVDAIGGVDVCVPNAVDDHKSGLTLPAGTSHVDGTMGLAFVRARYIDPTADLGRMQRQQQFLGAMFQRATSLGVLLNPAKLSGFLDAALSSVDVDESLTRDRILDLAGELHGLKPKNLHFLTVPLADVSGTVDGVGSVVQWDRAKARQLFAALDADTAWSHGKAANRVTVAPGDIRVQVLNGSTVTGLAGQASKDLAAKGFVIGAAPGNADADDVTTTVVRYDPEWNESVNTLRATFPDARFETVPGLGATFQVVVGTDYVAPRSVKVVADKQQLSSHTAADDVCG